MALMLPKSGRLRPALSIGLFSLRERLAMRSSIGPNLATLEVGGLVKERGSGILKRIPDRRALKTLNRKPHSWYFVPGR